MRRTPIGIFLALHPRPGLPVCSKAAGWVWTRPLSTSDWYRLIGYAYGLGFYFINGNQNLVAWRRCCRATLTQQRGRTAMWPSRNSHRPPESLLGKLCDLLGPLILIGQCVYVCAHACMDVWGHNLLRCEATDIQNWMQNGQC